MGLLNYENQIIGRLIKFYRTAYYEKTHNSKYLIKNMISIKSDEILQLCPVCSKQCKGRKGICSEGTFRDIEKGNVAKNECFYIDLASKVHKRYQVSYKDSLKIESLSNRIRNHIFTNNKDLLISILKEADKFHEEKKNILFYSEITALFQGILKFQLYAVLPDKEMIDIIEFISPNLKPNEQLYSYILLHRYYTFNCLNDIKRMDYFNKIIIIEPSFLNYQLSEKYKTLDKIDYYIYLKQVDIETLTPIDKYTVLHRKAHAALRVDKYDVAYRYMCTSDEIVESEKLTLPKSEEMKVTLRKAIILYEVKKYEEALEEFKKVWFFDINLLALNILQFMTCFEKLGKLEERNSFLLHEDLAKITNPKIKAVFNYYQQKQVAKTTKEYHELAEIICEDLKPFVRDGTIFDGILKSELKDLCQKTSSYRYLWEFIFYDENHGYK